MAKEQYFGTGRRKSSVARVILVPGNGKITINKSQSVCPKGDNQGGALYVIRRRRNVIIFVRKCM